MRGALDVPLMRLRSQRIALSRFKEPEDVVSWLVGLQGQDLASAKWSVGLRLPGSTEADVDRAFAAGRILRTWPMRGTLHVVAAGDVRWLLALTAAANLARTAYRRRELELDARTLSRSEGVLSKALEGGALRSRAELFAQLEGAKISTEGQRGYHLLWHAAVNGLLCYAAPRGQEQAFALLDDWVAPAPAKAREAAVAELALRYFSSRGPATLEDFTWWAGLGVREARAGLEAVAARLSSTTGDGRTWWFAEERRSPATLPAAFALPGFDEFLLGYSDRSAVLEPAFSGRICPGGNGVFRSTLVLGGQVVGTWRRTVRRTTVDLSLEPFRPLKKAGRSAAERALAHYAAFLGRSSSSAPFASARAR